jgi:hypothetical protein
MKIHTVTENSINKSIVIGEKEKEKIKENSKENSKEKAQQQFMCQFHSKEIYYKHLHKNKFYCIDCGVKKE